MMAHRKMPADRHVGRICALGHFTLIDQSADFREFVQPRADKAGFTFNLGTVSVGSCKAGLGSAAAKEFRCG